jgi:4-aminobutyrate aminotransferase
MLSKERAVSLHEAGFLAEVLGFETEEVADSALGAVVTSYSGRELLDFTGGIAVHACGHNHPEIVQAITHQAQKMLHISDIMRHAPQLELGGWITDLLNAKLPGESPWSILFMNSGSESIDASAKLALKATGRTHFVALEGAFHGRTLFATALSRSKRLHWQAYEGFLTPLRPHIHHIPAPRCGSCERQSEPCCLRGFERLLEEHGSEIAALYVEPQQGEGGYIPLPKETAQRLRALTRNYGILLVVDEIQTGWGRTGRWFGFEHLEIEPDIVVFGKAVGGGLPLAGVLARQDLMARWSPGEQGTTFGGNPLACAAGYAALRLIEREGWVERAAQLGERIQTRLAPLVGKKGVVDVRGHGLMIGVELRDAQGAPDYARCEAVKKRAQEAGLLLLSCGAKIGVPRVDNAALRLIPPLNISEEALEEGLTRLEQALSDTPNATNV